MPTSAIAAGVVAGATVCAIASVVLTGALGSRLAQALIVIGLAALVVVVAATAAFRSGRAGRRRVDAIRRRLLDAAAAERARVAGDGRFVAVRVGQHIIAGLDAAVAAIEGVPMQGEPDEYLSAVEAALDAARTRLSAEPDDRDGWAVGGVTSLRARVAQERRALGDDA